MNDWNAALLADLSLRATAVLIVAIVAAWWLRRRSAAVRHVVWVVACSGLLALPLLNFSLPPWHVIPAAWQNAALESRPVAREIPQVTAWEQPPPRTPAAAPGSHETTVPAIPSASTPGPEAVQATGRGNTSRRPVAGSVLSLIWFAGLMLILSRIAVSQFWMRRIIRKADVVQSGPLRNALDQLMDQFNWKDGVKLVVTRTGAMPMACGIWSPTILLPPQSKDWTSAQGRSVLLHEFGHILRRDPLSNLLIEISRAVYWFHPLAWLAARRAAAERERACDDLVLQSGIPAVEYARHLLDVVSGGRLSRFHLSAGVAMASTRRLDRRLRSLMHAAQDRRPLRRFALAATLLVGPCLLVPIAVVRPGEPPPSGSEPAELEREADIADDPQDPAPLSSPGFLPGAPSAGSLRPGGEPSRSSENPPGVTDEVRRQTLETLNELNDSIRRDPGTETRIQQYERAFRMQSRAAELTGRSQESQPSEVWEVRLRAVDERTGEPIPNPRFIVQLSGDRWTEHAGDADGEFVAKFATRMPRYCYLKVRADGYAAMQGFWSNRRDEPPDVLPEQLVFEMEPSIPVGGVVVDEDGEPVEGARVYFGASNRAWNQGRRIQQSFYREPCITNATGRWQCHLAPPGIDSASFRVEHPDFVQPDPDMNFGLDDQIPQLKEQTHRWQLKRGFVIRGRVVDANGLPVEGAVLAVGELNIYRRSVFARTDTEGRFMFPRVAPMHDGEIPRESHRMTITAMKPGLAPAMEMVPGFGGRELGESTSDSRILSVTLRSGRRMGFEFRDSAGDPVPDVRVQFREWQSTNPFSALQQFGIPREADADGKWTWEWAPEGEIEYGFGAPGFRDQNLRATADGNVREVTLEREQVITGRVVDAGTGEPIPLFYIEAGWPQTRYHPDYERSIVWMSTRGTRSGADGEYRLPVNWAGDTLHYRALAEGYEPVESGAVTVEEGEVTLDFELRRMDVGEESDEM